VILSSPEGARKLDPVSGLPRGRRGIAVFWQRDGHN